MTFRPVSIRDTPPDLNVTMELHGVRATANKLQIERMAEDYLGDAAPDIDLSYNVLVIIGPPDCMCQVFYHKIRLNCWRIVFAFFPKDKLDVSKSILNYEQLLWYVYLI